MTTNLQYDLKGMALDAAGALFVDRVEDAEI